MKVLHHGLSAVKHLKHLICLLTKNGCKKENIKIVRILMGTSMTIYNEYTIKRMQKLGIPHVQVPKCARTKHIHAIKLLHSIDTVRRRLEFIRTDPRNTPHVMDSNWNAKNNVAT